MSVDHTQPLTVLQYGTRNRRNRQQLGCLYLVTILLAAAPASAGWGPITAPNSIVVRTQSSQQGGETRLSLAAVILATPASETRLAIEIAPLDTIPRNSFVRIRGLPPTVALSEGHAIAPGAWAVPIAALDKLKIVLPAGLTGKSQIAVALMSLEGTVLAERTVALIVASAELIAPPAAASGQAQAPASGSATALIAVSPRQAGIPAAPPRTNADPLALPRQAVPAPPRPAPPAQPSVASPEVPSETLKRAQGYLVRGNGLLDEGNIASARLFFQRAADDGLADGALAMGATFDPDELARLRVAGLKGEVGQARKWYERAVQLGSNEAQERLRRLQGR